MVISASSDHCALPQFLVRSAEHERMHEMLCPSLAELLEDKVITFVSHLFSVTLPYAKSEGNQFSQEQLLLCKKICA
jgi:hypothetical protein